MKNFAQYFPAISKGTYLDTPAIGLMPADVWEFKKSQDTEMWQEGSRYFLNNAGMSDEVREKIAAVYNGNPGYVALFPAFSYGLNAILEGLQPGIKVLLLRDDYPSINRAVEARDFKVSYAAIDENLEEHILAQFKKDTPDIFIFSIVQYLNGIKIDFSLLKSLKQDYPDTLFIGDGTQYLGTERFDFNRSGIDVLGASAYKWIGAGFGNGFFMFKPQAETRINPKYLGFGSVVGKYKESGETLIGKLEGNHLNLANIGSIKKGLEFQEKIGFEDIENKIKQLSATAKQKLAEAGLLEESVVHRTNHANIFNLKGDEALFQKLQLHHIFCSQRGQGIRIGLHYYNNSEDIDKLLTLVTE